MRPKQPTIGNRVDDVQVGGADRSQGPEPSDSGERANKTEASHLLQTESAKLKDYLAVLKPMPDDPAANLGAGRFYCLLRDDWLQGTAMLIKGSDEKLKVAAQKDLQAGGGTVNDLLLAADAWYDLLANADPSLKPAIHARALFWYTAAEPALTA